MPDSTWAARTAHPAWKFGGSSKVRCALRNLQQYPGGCSSTAGLAAQVGRLLEALAAVLEATKAQVEKRAALSFEELQAEQAEAEEVRRSILLRELLYHFDHGVGAGSAAPSCLEGCRPSKRRPRTSRLFSACACIAAV